MKFIIHIWMLLILYLLASFTTFLFITLIPLPMYSVVSEMTNIYLLKVNNRNTRTSMQNMFSANHKNVIDVVLVFLLLTLNIFRTFF